MPEVGFPGEQTRDRDVWAGGFLVGVLGGPHLWGVTAAGLSMGGLEGTLGMCFKSPVPLISLQEH